MTRFDFAFAPAYRRLAWPWGVTPETAWVEVRVDEVFEARFGFWRVRTSVTNITDVDVTGPYAFWKTPGPARLAITDRGLTSATAWPARACIGSRTGRVRTSA